MIYTFVCSRCGHHFEIKMGVNEYSISSTAGSPIEADLLVDCPNCHFVSTAFNFQRVFTVPNFVLNGEGWTRKSGSTLGDDVGEYK